MFNAAPNDQKRGHLTSPLTSTLLQFIDILNIKLVDTLLMMPQIVYATRLRSGLFGEVKGTLQCCLLPKPDSVANTVWVIAVKIISLGNKRVVHTHL